MYIEKKTIDGKPYYYARRKMVKKGRQTTDTAAYLCRNILIAHIRFLLIQFGLIKPSS